SITGLPFIDDVLRHPIITSIVLVCTSIFIYVNHKNVPADDVSFNYGRIVENFEIWRMVSSTFTHYGILHIIFNMTSLWSYRMAETIGDAYYVKNSFLLMIISFGFMLGCYKLLISKMGREEYRNVNAVGYSCILFGWMTIVSFKNPNGTVFFGIPMYLMPFVSLVFTSLIFPQASFLGHLSGIFGGVMIHYNLFIWYHDIVFYITFPPFIAFMIYNKIKTRNVDPEQNSMLPLVVTNFFSNLAERVRSRGTSNEPSIVNGVLRSNLSPTVHPQQTESTHSPIQPSAPPLEEQPIIYHQEQHSDEDQYDYEQDDENLLSNQARSDDQEMDEYLHYSEPKKVREPEPQVMYSSTTFVLKARLPSGDVISILDLDQYSTLSDLCTALMSETGIAVENQQILHSYPPKVLSKENMSATLLDIGIKNGEQIIVKDK
ncbi:hypothetical protein AKO1_005319, partial [Acrasis kona]